MKLLFLEILESKKLKITYSDFLPSKVILSPPLPAWTVKLKVDGEHSTFRIAEITSTLWPWISTRHSEMLDVGLPSNKETIVLPLAKDIVHFCLIRSTADVFSLFLEHIFIQGQDIIHVCSLISTKFPLHSLCIFCWRSLLELHVGKF